MDLTAAIILLWMPSSTIDAKPTAEEFAVIKPQIEYLAKQLELMDEKETIGTPENFATAMLCFRCARENFIDRWPQPSPARDNWRMPTREWAESQKRQGERHRDKLFEFALLYPGSDLAAEMLETNRLVAIWESVIDYHRGWSFLAKRYAMQRYVEFVGLEAFGNCECPPAYPYHK